MQTVKQLLRILELEPGASDADIESAYHDLVRVWHPDRFAHDPDLQRKADERLRLINDAYARLRSLREPGAEEGVRPASNAPRSSRDDVPADDACPPFSILFPSNNRRSAAYTHCFSTKALVLPLVSVLLCGILMTFVLRFLESVGAESSAILDRLPGAPVRVDSGRSLTAVLERMPSLALPWRPRVERNPATDSQQVEAPDTTTPRPRRNRNRPTAPIVPRRAFAALDGVWGAGSQGAIEILNEGDLEFTAELYRKGLAAPVQSIRICAGGKAAFAGIPLGVFNVALSSQAGSSRVPFDFQFYRTQNATEIRSLFYTITLTYGEAPRTSSR